MQAHFILGLSNIGIGVLLVALSRPLVLGKVKPNPFYGVRFPKSFASEANWYAINRFGGQRLTFWAFWLMLCGLLEMLLPLRPGSSLLAVLGFLPVLLVLIPSIESYRFSKTL